MALTKDTNRDFYVGDLEKYPMAAGAKIYKGSAVGENAAGYARALVAGDKFLGFAEDSLDNTNGSAGDKSILTRRRGAVSIPVTGLAITDNDGIPVYASDDGTFTKTAAGNSLIGFTRRYESSGVGIVEYDANYNPSAHQQVAGATFTIGAESTDARTVSIQLLDAANNEMAVRSAVLAYLSSDANGDVIEAASGTLSVAAGADGAIVETSTDNGFLLISEADGDIDVTITQTSGADTFYLVLVMPNGRLVVSQAIAFA